MRRAADEFLGIGNVHEFSGSLLSANHWLRLSSEALHVRCTNIASVLTIGISGTWTGISRNSQSFSHPSAGVQTSNRSLGTVCRTSSLYASMAFATAAESKVSSLDASRPLFCHITIVSSRYWA